jgi:hypothetical protein
MRYLAWKNICKQEKCGSNKCYNFDVFQIVGDGVRDEVLGLEEHLQARTEWQHISAAEHVKKSSLYLHVVGGVRDEELGLEEQFHT